MFDTLKISTNAAPSDKVNKGLEELSNQRRIRKATENVDLAQAQFGLAYMKFEIDDKVISSIRPKWGWRRRAEWTRVVEYGGHIPDQAIERYQIAKESGLFDSISVVVPMYKKPYEKARIAPDPWLIGRVRETNDGERRYIVLAYWD